MPGRCGACRELGNSHADPEGGRGGGAGPWGPWRRQVASSSARGGYCRVGGCTGALRGPFRVVLTAQGSLGGLQPASLSIDVSPHWVPLGPQLDRDGPASGGLSAPGAHWADFLVLTPEVVSAWAPIFYNTWAGGSAGG